MKEARIFYQQDCDLSLLNGKTIAVIGYGSQGHAHALNAKDSGCNVIIGLYEGSKSWAKAEAQGFEVTLFDPAAGLNGKQLLASTPIKEFVNQFDAVMLFVHVAGFSQSNVRRITWAMPMGPDIPWYVTELPTVCVSVFNPFHLIDVPMVPTYINAYSDNDATLDLVIEKIMGKSEFKGVSSVDAFCGAWDTRL